VRRWRGKENKLNNILGRSALYYAKHFEWAVFPCKPGEKIPLTPNGFKDATVDTGKIAEWWRRWPDANVAVATGQVSNLLAVDIDDRNGGNETLDGLISKYTPLPHTVESLTGGGGQHLLFRYPGGGVRSGANKLGPGVDVKADGGYIIVPPSVHPSGGVYQWEIASRPTDTPIHEPPEWLLDLMGKESEPGPAPSSQNGSSRGEIKFVGRGALDFVANGAPLGVQRSRALAAARNFLAAGVSEAVVVDKVWQGLENSPQDPREPWTVAEVQRLVADLKSHKPPPPQEIVTPAQKKTAYRQDELEMIFAASVYAQPEQAMVSAGWLLPDRIFHKGVRKFWTAIVDTHDVHQAATDAGILKDVLRWQPYIDPQDVGEYARQVVRQAYMRGVANTVPRLSTAVSAGDIDDVQKLVAGLQGGAPETGRKPRSAVDGLLKFIETINNVSGRSIMTHLESLDTAMGGFERQTMTILAARPSMGKSTLAWQIARSVGEHGGRALFFSVEVSETSLWAKAACGALGIRWRDVRNGSITEAQRHKLEDVASDLMTKYQDNVLVDDGALNTDALWQVVLKSKPDFVVVDHIGLLSDSADTDVIRLGNITRRLKEVAKVTDSHVMAIHQLNRGVESRDNKRPSMSDLRGSGHIEENADNVLMLYRDDYYNIVDASRYSLTEVLIRKFRDDVANQCAYINFDKQSQNFGKQLP
jgi:replicative DNA helicase